MANIFQLFGEIFIDNAKADASIDKTTKKAEGSGSKMGSAFKTITNGAVAMGTAVVTAATTVGSAAYGMAMKTANQADYIDKLSERTGINREELQRWKHAADQSGVSIDSFKNGIKKMSDVVDDANNGSNTARTSLERLGLSLNDLNKMSTEEQFNTITAALADMEAGAERNALGNDLLGKSYTEMLPMLNAGSEGMKALKKEADDLGLVMSENTVKAGVVLGDTIANVKDAGTGLLNRIGAAAIPLIQKVADMMIEGLPKVQALFDRLIPIVTSIFDKVLPPLFTLVETLLPILFTLLETLLPPIESIITAVLPVVVSLLEQLLPFVVELIEQILPIAVDLIEGIMPLVTQIIETVLPILISLIKAILPPILQIIEAVLPVIIQLLEILLPPILQIVETVLPVIVDLINLIMPVLVQIIEAILPVIIQLVNMLLPPIMQIIELILPILITCINTFVPIMLTIVQAILPVLLTLLDVLMPVIQPILDILLLILEPLLQLINEILPPVCDFIKNIYEKLLPPLSKAFSEVANIIGGVFKNAFEGIKKVFENVKGVFNGIISFVKNVFTGNWRGAWNSVVSIFTNIFDGIRNAFKIPINYIIDGINVFIDGLNKLQIPDWVPGVGGMGLNISNIDRLRIGMSYVPYDEYPALLHKGERVLTAGENKEYSSKMSDTASDGVPNTQISIKLSDKAIYVENLNTQSEDDFDSFVERVLEAVGNEIKRKGVVFA